MGIIKKIQEKKAAKKEAKLAAEKESRRKAEIDYLLWERNHLLSCIEYYKRRQLPESFKKYNDLKHKSIRSLKKSLVTTGSVKRNATKTEARLWKYRELEKHFYNLKLFIGRYKEDRQKLKEINDQLRAMGVK